VSEVYIIAKITGVGFEAWVDDAGSCLERRGSGTAGWASTVPRRYGSSRAVSGSWLLPWSWLQGRGSRRRITVEALSAAGVRAGWGPGHSERPHICENGWAPDRTVRVCKGLLTTTAGRAYSQL
jgi:hypothetical protein